MMLFFSLHHKKIKKNYVILSILLVLQSLSLSRSFGSEQLVYPESLFLKQTFDQPINPLIKDKFYLAPNFSLYKNIKKRDTNDLLIKKTVDGSFTKNKISLIKKLSSAKNIEEKYNIYIKFVELLFQNSMYNEALDTYYFVVSHFSSVHEKNFRTEFFIAVSLSMLERVSEAKSLFVDMINKYTKESSSKEFLLWYNYALSLNGNDNVNYKPFLDLLDTIKQNYPISIFLKISSQFLKELFDQQKYELILSLKNLSSDSYLFYASLAQYKMFKNEESLLQQLTNIVSQGSIYWSLRAQKALIEKNINSNKISTENGIEELYKLNFKLLNAPKLRFDTLILIADLYRKLERIEDTLHISRYLESHFENLRYEVNTFIKNYTRDFITVLSQEDKSNWEILEFFYNYEDSLYLGNSKNEIIDKIINSLINLNLLEEAKKLLEHKIFTLPTNARLNDTFKLIKVNMNLKNFKESINLLNHAEIFDNEFLNYKKILFLKSLNFMYLENYERALNIINSLKSPEITKLREEIFFKKGDYKSYIENSKESELILDLDSNSEKNAQYLKLGISYFVLENKNELENLYNKIPNELDSIKMLTKFFISSVSCDYYSDCYKESLNILNEMSTKISSS